MTKQPTEWTTYAIENLLANETLYIGDGYRAKSSELAETGLPFARAGNIGDGFQFQDADRFPVRDLSKVGIKISESGDIVFTSKGTVGRFALVKESTERFVYSPQLSFWRVLNRKIIEPRFLYHWMYGQEFYRQFYGVKGQTDMADYVSLRDQRRMHITLPPLPEQRAIAAILGSLDDKIELNRWMNATLEAIAHALFKSWFVDFDPVYANRGERASSLPAEVLALFPDTLVESELGMIPAGWEVRSAGKVVKAVGGSTPRTKDSKYWEGGTHYFATPKHLSDISSPILFETNRKVTDAGLAKISSGLLPIGTVLLSSRAPVGYLALTEAPVCINQGFIAMICNGPVSNYYMLNWADAHLQIIKGRASGTTFAEISKRNFRKILVLVPDPRIMQVFDSSVAPLYEKITQGMHESRTLAELRDTLLPRLISGQLRAVPLRNNSGNRWRVRCPPSFAPSNPR